MKRKRLNYESWGFQYFPYFQIRVDCDDFHGLATVIKIVAGEPQCWETPKAGCLQVCGKGMMWLQLVPDHQKHVINIKFFPWGQGVPEERCNYPEFALNNTRCPSVWYVDVIDDLTYDEDGVAVFIDKYIDVIFTPEGDVHVDDRDELDAAYESGELTKEQYESALAEVEVIKNTYCNNLKETAEWTERVRREVDGMIFGGQKPMYLFHGSPKKLEIIEPQQAGGEGAEGLKGVYAGESLHEVAPFALPIKPQNGHISFSCDDGCATIHCGYLDPEDHGYVYRVKPDTFRKVDEWEWVSTEPVVPIEVKEIAVKDVPMH